MEVEESNTKQPLPCIDGPPYEKAKKLFFFSFSLELATPPCCCWFFFFFRELSGSKLGYTDAYISFYIL